MTRVAVVTVFSVVVGLLLLGVVVGALLRMDEPVRERVVHVTVETDPQ